MRSVRGTPSTIASMFAPNVVCSWVCLNRLFSTTLATPSRERVMTIRMPMRSELSLWIARMPLIFFSLTRPAIDSTRLSGLTW